MAGSGAIPLFLTGWSGRPAPARQLQKPDQMRSDGERRRQPSIGYGSSLGLGMAVSSRLTQSQPLEDHIGVPEVPGGVETGSELIGGEARLHGRVAGQALAEVGNAAPVG